MDNTNSERIYKTTLSQREAYYRYAFFNREKVNERFNKYYNSNENYRKNKIDKVKKAYLYKTESKKFLNILIDEIDDYLII